MAKPILKQINAFDATKDYTIGYTWSGNQQKSVTCLVKNNITNATVYTATQTTMKLEFTIPANSLANSTTPYTVSIKVTDVTNTDSDYANNLLFYCFNTPTFKSNISSGDIIRNAVYDVILTYSQTQNEPLQQYRVLLYDVNKKLLYDSNIRYNTDNMTVKISNLKDNAQYYIRATGITLNGMELDTDYIQFSADYTKPEGAYFICSLENQHNDGTIYSRANIISVEGVTDKTPTYIDNKYIDLNNNTVKFHEGFNIENNFTLNIKGYNFKTNDWIANLSNNKGHVINLFKRKIILSDGEKEYFELKVPVSANDNSLVYVTHSNYLSPTIPTDILSVWIRRRNNYYDVWVEVIV